MKSKLLLTALVAAALAGCQQTGQGPTLPAPIGIQFEQAPAKPAGK